MKITYHLLVSKSFNGGEGDRKYKCQMLYFNIGHWNATIVHNSWIHHVLIIRNNIYKVKKISPLSLNKNYQSPEIASWYSYRVLRKFIFLRGFLCVRCLSRLRFS